MATIASLKVNILGDSTGLSNSLKSATDKMQAFGSRMTEIGSTLSTRLTLPIVGFGALAVKSASDAEETFSKFATVFRDVESESTKAFETLRNEYGLSSKASKQLLSDTGDLLTGFGFSQQSALELSTEVNKLAVDLASFTNFSGGAEGASRALTKALLGERESIKSLGIAIMEEDVQKRVAINTTKGLTFESERQAKAFATLQIAQEQSKNAIGDYARTQDSFANQFKLLQARLGDLAVEFGQVMLPALNGFVGMITRVTDKISGMDENTKRLTVGIAILVAGIGPLLVLVGGLTKAFAALNIVLLANPYIAIATAVLAIGTAAYFALGGLDDMNKQIRESIGLKEQLTGSEDEYNKMLKKQEELNAERLRIEGLIAQGVSPQQGAFLGQQLGRIDQQMRAVRVLAREWNGVRTVTQQAGASTVQATDSGIAGVRQMAYELRTVNTELKLLDEGFRDNFSPSIREMSDAWVEWGDMADYAQRSIDGMSGKIEQISVSTVIAQQFAQQFTDSFGAGMANLVVQGGKFVDILKNIGKLMLSAAIQTFIKYMLLGSVGFGVKGGSTGLIGGLFSGSASMAGMGAVTPASASLTLDGQFQIRGTDLVYVMNRAERSFR
jgi:multisubunit Na+/H+ antiporter MnhG subunit